MNDYVIEDGEVKKRMVSIRVGDKVDLDHQPVETWIKRGIKKRKERERTERRKGVWYEEGSNR